jgi:hypothetical protein
MFNKVLKIFLLSIIPVTGLQAQKIKTSYSSSAFTGPFSGRVILYLSKKDKEPKLSELSDSSYFFSKVVKDIKPNTTIVFDDSAASYPKKLSKLDRGQYYAQVVWDRNTGEREIGRTVDNMYNESVKLNFTNKSSQSFSISCNKKIKEREFKESKYVKKAKIASSLLSKFYKRPTTIDVAVILPVEYFKDTTRKFPIEFYINGYGGPGYWGYSGIEGPSEALDTIPFIIVFLDGNCPTGHSTYVNSPNSGPWGDALVHDFIPAFEKKFRCNGCRLLDGHSSGGWSSLWLQINYPKVFAGCWASSPNPVDHRSFQNIDLYKDRNLFYDTLGTLFPWGIGPEATGWYTFKDHYQMEEVIGRGDECISLNNVYGLKRKDGTSESICNFTTGEIDSNVVAHWRNYDISWLLREHWEKYKNDIDDKIRITVGTSDNFSLENSVKLLEQEMKKLNSKIEFAYYPGTHFTVYTPEYRKDGDKFLARKYAEWLKQKK